MIPCPITDRGIFFCISQRYTLAMIRKWRSQKEIPTPTTEVGKNLINNQVYSPSTIDFTQYEMFLGDASDMVLFVLCFGVEFYQI